MLPAGAPLRSTPAAAWPPRAAAPLRGGKGQTWECGVRVPAIISYPARWAGDAAIHAVTSTLDLMPTVLRLAGAAAPLRYVSELADGELATPGVLDGRDLTPLLDGLAGQLHDDAVMLYCGAHVAAARLGRFKAHFSTVKWEDEAAQTCPRKVICECEGHVHGVPLLYDVHDDPGETSPLDPREHAELIARFVAARARHEASLVRVPSQTELLPTPSHVPCCGVPRGSVEHIWKLFWARHECGC